MGTKDPDFSDPAAEARLTAERLTGSADVTLVHGAGHYPRRRAAHRRGSPLMPRAGLTLALVVARAGDLADLHGYDALNLAALAEQLGVRVPSLYKHITSLSDLQRRLAVEGLRGLGEAQRAAAVDRAGSDALHAVAHAYRHYAHTHPGRYAAAVRAPAPDDQEAQTVATGLTRMMLAIMRGYHLDGDAALHAVRAARAALHGFTALEQAAGFGMPYDIDTSFDQLITILDAGLRHHASSKR
jgi:AcrR family transcriptional regulator